MSRHGSSSLMAGFQKDHVSKVSTPLADRSGSYGVGMFGIGAR